MTSSAGPRFSSRIARLAQPRTNNARSGDLITSTQSDFDSYNVQVAAEVYRVPTALRSIRSVGIAKLAMPRVVQHKFVRAVGSQERIRPRVSPHALKYKASVNVSQLAEPRRYIDADTRRRPYTVVRKALRQVSPRQLAYFERLAKPR